MWKSTKKQNLLGLSYKLQHKEYDVTVFMVVFMSQDWSFLHSKNRYDFVLKLRLSRCLSLVQWVHMSDFM